jgi:hypothetical protein
VLPLIRFPLSILNSEIVERLFVFILCRKASFGEVFVDMAPLVEAAVIEHLQFVGNNEWHDIAGQTFLK